MRIKLKGSKFSRGRPIPMRHIERRVYAVYFNCNGQNQMKTRETAIEISNYVKNVLPKTTVFCIPINDGATKIECLNPVVVSRNRIDQVKSEMVMLSDGVFLSDQKPDFWTGDRDLDCSVSATSETAYFELARIVHQESMVDSVESWVSFAAMIVSSIFKMERYKVRRYLNHLNTLYFNLLLNDLNFYSDPKKAETKAASAMHLIGKLIEYIDSSNNGWKFNDLSDLGKSIVGSPDADYPIKP